MQIDRFEGRVAFITGGARGIGLGMARALAREGAKVAIADVDTDALAAAERELGAVTDVASVTLDVRDRAAFAAVADDVEKRLGPVTLLFNNAGVITSTSPGRMNYESWDWVIGVNLNGVYNGVQTFVPRMIERQSGGYVVNTASGAGLVALGSGFLYATSKFGVVGLSESLHVELSHHGIGVSVLCPGPVATDIVSNSRKLRPPSEDQSTRARQVMATAEASLAQGTPPDAVGTIVLDAMREGRLFIYTDASMAEPIRIRTELLLGAIPSTLST